MIVHRAGFGTHIAFTNSMINTGASMEKILVSMDARHGAWEAWSRAISLARRIGSSARLYALLVVPEGHAGAVGDAGTAMVRERFELEMELAQAQGLHVDCFITQGNYDEEVIRFARHNQITLLVLEQDEGGKHPLKRSGASSRGIVHRICCRVELVTPRKHKF